MKIKVYVIDFEIAPRVKKWAVRLGVPAALLVGGGVAFAGLPGGYADGQPLTAAELSANFNYLQSEVSGQAVVPSGAVMFFNLATCPTGWSPATAAQGRYIVGLDSSGTLAATVGTALTDQENRPVGQHAHSVTDPGHIHDIQQSSAEANGGGTGGIFGLYFNSGTNYTTTQASFTGITVSNAGSVAGTNAPYVQYLACQKD